MLIGIIDPSHGERKDRAPGSYPRWYPVDDLLGIALAEGPKWSPWPYELIQAALTEHQERDYISSSALVGGCMRGTIIERKAEYIADLDSMYAALMGTLMHRTLEYASRPGALAEWRFWTTVDGVEVSCSPDHIDPNTGTLTDWKKTDNPPSYYPWPSHKEQVQLNRFIFNNAERWADQDGNEDAELHVDPRSCRINHVVVTYLGPKGPTVMEVQKSIPWTTPNNKVIKRKVPDVWDDATVLELLRPRLEAWQLAMDAYPDWPDGLESMPGWAGPPEWRCPGAPLCYLPNCLAKRWPHMLTWESS